MFTEDKVTKIFCMADDFCKFYDAMITKLKSNMKGALMSMSDRLLTSNRLQRQR